VVGNNGLARALNLDENEIAVTIGGRGFVLKQQAKVPLMRVLDAIFKSDEDEIKTGEDEEGEKPALEETVAQTFIKEWDKALPVIAMMFGFHPDKEDEWSEVTAFLGDNLAPMAGVKVFRAWWQLNEIDSFFIRCGRTMLHPEMEVGIEAELKRQLSARVRTMMDDALQAQTVTSE
jgi:hypothetical protein